jgi:hypothetical protein
VGEEEWGFAGMTTENFKMNARFHIGYPEKKWNGLNILYDKAVNN